MFYITECPLCFNRDFTKKIDCTDYTVSKKVFQIVSCKNCGFNFTNPRPNTEDLGSYYQSDEYTSHTSENKSIVDIIYRISRFFTLRWKVGLIRKYTDESSISIQDYGSGTGDFLKACQEKGWKTTGVEPSENARKVAKTKGVENIAPTLTDTNQTFTSITLWHVLEHVPDLSTTLARLTSQLKKNGTIFIAVPNHESPDAKKYQSRWAGYDVPRHLWHFRKDDVQQLLNKNNLELLKIVPMKLDAYYVSILSNKNTNGRNSITGFISGLINGGISNLKARKENNYSSLIYIARKK